MSDSAEQRNVTSLEEIASDIKHMFFHQDALILFSSLGTVHQLDTRTGHIDDGTHSFGPEDSNIMYTQSICQPLDASLVEFFSLDGSDTGFLFSTDNGCIYWRNTTIKEDIKLENFEGSEQVLKIDVVCVPELSNKLNVLLFFG